MELNSSCFLDKDHMMGVIQDMVAKDKRPALSRGLHLNMDHQQNIEQQQQQTTFH